MFQLTKEEMENWTSQIGITNKEKKRRPYAFTEQGVAMLKQQRHKKLRGGTNRVMRKRRYLSSDRITKVQEADRCFFVLEYGV